MFVYNRLKGRDQPTRQFGTRIGFGFIGIFALGLLMLVSTEFSQAAEAPAAPAAGQG
ncbi:MAG: hypothetical protein ORO03_07800 [Alphaproteobacteria bacterium]|nr:hypothetical protein [Alphaproteobacteria bacterium]